jgi:hypothetical protein
VLEPGEAATGADPTQKRFSRRQLLGSAGASALVLAGAGFGIDQWVESGGPSTSTDVLLRPYRSRPDLWPADVTTLVPAGGTAPGLIFLGPIAGAGQFGPMIIDNLGDLVWFHPLKSTKATNLQVQHYRGQPVLAWWEGKVVSPGYGKGECVLMDTSYREITRIRAGNGLMADLHELFITPEGTALMTAYRLIETDLTSVDGPRRGMLLNSLLQEVDIATGRVLFEWDAHSHVALSESYLPVPTNGGHYDFFHINSIDVDTDGNLLVSGRHTWTVYKIDRRTGAIIWRLNGKLSDFSMGPRTQFAYQHHARHHPGNQLTIFDDGGGATNVDNRSRGLKLELDMTAMQAGFVHEYHPNPEFLATSQGSVQVLANGNVFVGWGGQPYWSEYAADGRLLFDAQLPKGGDSYRTFRFPWQGQPKDHPSIAAERSGQGRVTAYVSWNGATEVATWELLAGPGAGTLGPIASAPRLGFETAITAKINGSHVAVAARDSTGQLLATSPTIRV